MECPGCGAVLIAIEFMGVELDYCPQCGGVWLDKGEFADILDMAEVASGGLTEALYNAPSLSPGKGKCPRCGRPLGLVQLETAQSPIALDRCPDHHGLWLDRGEMGDIIQWFGQDRGVDTGAVAQLLHQMFGHDLRSNDKENHA